LIPFVSIPVPETNTNGPFQQAQLTVTDLNPVWVYCRQTGHCQQGMVFAINPGTQFAAFQAAAMGSSTSQTSATSAASPAATSAAPAATATSPTSTSQDHKIIVGGGPLTFQPSNITAQPGDTVTFEFHVKNHTVTQSSFAAPCEMLASSSTSGQVGFDSGLYVLFPPYYMHHSTAHASQIPLACPSPLVPPRSLHSPSR
jgi:plastocyanin